MIDSIGGSDECSLSSSHLESSIISVIGVNVVFIVGSGTALMEDVGMDSVMTVSKVVVLRSGIAASMRSAGALGFCSATTSAVDTSIPSITFPAGIPGDRSVPGLVKHSFMLSACCSPKLSVILSVTGCSTGSGRGCNVVSSGGVVVDFT